MGITIIGVVNIILMLVLAIIICFRILDAFPKVVSGEKLYTGSEECYSHYKSRYVRKFCIYKNLGGYVKRFGYINVLQTYDAIQMYDYDFGSEWVDDSFVELRIDSDGNNKYHKLYNNSEELIYL